jgi:hypothetical protein
MDSVCASEVTENRTSGLEDYLPQMPNYQECQIKGILL